MIAIVFCFSWKAMLTGHANTGKVSVPTDTSGSATVRCWVCSASLSLQCRSGLVPNTCTPVSLLFVLRQVIRVSRMSRLAKRISTSLKSVERKFWSWLSKRCSIAASVERSDSDVATKMIVRAEKDGRLVRRAERERQVEDRLLEVRDVFQEPMNERLVPVNTSFHFSVDLDVCTPEIVPKL